MHAGVVSVRLKPGKVKEAVQIYQDTVAPDLRQMRGFAGGYVLTNAEASEGYIIGLWETQEDAQRYESGGAYEEQAARFGEVLAEPPSREVYEVSVQV